MNMVNMGTNMKFKMIEKKIILLIVFFTLILSAMPAEAQSIFTKEEQEYIKKTNALKAVSIDGVAPLQYYDANGRVKGISIEVLEAISDMTGLIFTYHLYDNVDEAMSSDADIIFGVLEKIQSENVLLSIPYFKTETILYLNSSVSPNELENKKYAAIKGTPLPIGIKEENTIYFNTREDCMDAVDRGQADYGYGNAYSVAFYTLQNDYKNIITVPEKKEDRAYCIVVNINDEILLSIINKAISSIDEHHMRVLALNAATQIERRITIPMIIEAYGVQIFGAIILTMAILLYSIVYNVRAKNEIKIQYERYQMLSQTSNEYLYEYNVKTRNLELSKNCIELFGNSDNLSELITAFNKVFINPENTTSIIELPVANGEKGLFKSVNSFLYDDKGHAYSIIGKLIDISEEEAEKQELIKKSETDGMTGIYNAVTTKNLINDIIKNPVSNSKGALIIIDCDNFKDINDTQGHLIGDQVLVNISKAMIQTFRKTDTIGRIGGDEFYVYMQDISSHDFVVSKCQKLMDLISELNKGYDVTISIGISFLEGEKSYDALFKKADIALYDAKNSGRNCVKIYM